MKTDLTPEKKTAEEKIDFEKEKEAILAVIDEESRTYYERDFEAWKNTYVQEAYQMRMGYWEGYENAIQYVKGWDDLVEYKKNRFTRTTEDEWDDSIQDKKYTAIRIFPEVAWLTYEQKDYEAGTGDLLGDAVGNVIVEKKDEEWKIAYIGYFYWPMDENEDETGD